jgi:hypothetical protein
MNSSIFPNIIIIMFKRIATFAKLNQSAFFRFSNIKNPYGLLLIIKILLESNPMHHQKILKKHIESLLKNIILIKTLIPRHKKYSYKPSSI